MDKQNLMPHAAQPVNRITTGQLPAELAELSEEALQWRGEADFSSSVLPSHVSDCHVDSCHVKNCYAKDCYSFSCSYEGDDAE